MKKLKCWKKSPSGNQSENGNMFTMISKPVYQDKYLVTVGDRTKPKTVKRSWKNTKEEANKKAQKYMEEHDSC